MPIGERPPGPTNPNIRPRRRSWLERLLSTVVETTRAPILVTESTPPGESIIFANRAFLDLTGFPLREVLGRGSDLLYGAETSSEAIERIGSVIGSNGEGAVDVLLYRKDGTPF